MIDNEIRMGVKTPFDNIFTKIILLQLGKLKIVWENEFHCLPVWRKMFSVDFFDEKDDVISFGHHFYFLKQYFWS